MEFMHAVRRFAAAGWWTVFALATGVGLMLQGCASGAPSKVEKLISTDVMVPFVPARLLLNARVPVARFYENRLDFLQAELVKTRAFVALGSSVNSPVVIDLTLERGSDSGGVEATGQILSAATLFLVPAPVNGYHTLKADVRINGIFVRHYEYRDDYSTNTGVYNMGRIGTEKDPEFASIRNVAYKFINEIERDNVIPRTLD